MKMCYWLYRYLCATAAAVTALFTFLPAQTPILAAQPDPPAAPQTALTTLNWNDAAVWTRWSNEQYTLVQEGDDLWIGTGNGVLRWHIPTQTSTRYSVLDGLPSRRILAIAVDPAGNRWFGGDGGLSRFDTSGVWTHFTTANSGLYTNYVDGIAVGADGTVTQLRCDGHAVGQSGEGARRQVQLVDARQEIVDHIAVLTIGCENEHIVFVAVEHIAPGTAIQTVVAAHPAQDIVTRAAGQTVVALQTEQHIVKTQRC